VLPFTVEKTVAVVKHWYHLITVPNTWFCSIGF